MITPDQYREHYRQTAGNEIDLLLTDLIDRADALIADHCGYPAATPGGRKTIAQTAYTVYPRPGIGEEVRALILPVAPVVSITSVHVSGSWVYDATTLIDPAEYTADEHDLLWMLPTSSKGWIDEPRAQRVIVQAGYPALVSGHALIPIIAALVHHLLNKGQTDGVQSVTLTGQSLTPAQQPEIIPADIQDALAPYVLWRTRVA